MKRAGQRMFERIAPHGVASPRFGWPDYSAVAPGEVRRQILIAAIEVIAENEFENVTMDRIAAHAGVSRLKLYREFGNRSALIEAVIAFRLMSFDELFFRSTNISLPFSGLVESYLVTSADASRENSVTRRWASGSMKFIQVGSLIHRTSVATWTPVIEHAVSTSQFDAEFTPADLALWLMTLQYAFGRLVVEANLGPEQVRLLAGQFVSPAFASRERSVAQPDPAKLPAGQLA